MKKLIILVVISMIILSSFVFSEGTETIVYIDPDALGVVRAGSTLPVEDYDGENHRNFRLAYSNWDSKKEYLWLVPIVNATTRSSYLLFGDFNMSKVVSVTFDYVSDTGATSHYISLTKDSEGTQKVATLHVTEPSGGALSQPKIDNELEILDSSYNGPVYLFQEYDSVNKRIFTGNFKITLSLENRPMYNLYIDHDALGIVRGGPTLPDADYDGENHMNFRLNYSGWDTKQEYLWLGPKNEKPMVQPSYVLWGVYDMSKVAEVSFSYITDNAPADYDVSLTKDPEGTQKLATFHVTEATGGLANPKTGNKMEILNRSYVGPVYLHIEHNVSNKRMFTGQYCLKMICEPTAPEDKADYKGTQIRASLVPYKNKDNEIVEDDLRQGLRFCYDIATTGSDFDYDGINYTVVNEGALVILKDKLSNAFYMTVDQVGVLPGLVKQETLIDVTIDGKVLKSAYIYNIPEENRDTVILSRAYIECIDSEENIQYFYTDIQEKSLTSVYYDIIEAGDTEGLDESVLGWWQLKRGIPYEVASDGAYTWWTGPLALRHTDSKDATYFSYISTEGKMTVSSYNHDSKETESFSLASFEQDDHNSASLTVLPDSKIMAVYARHNMDSNLRWRITEAAEDIGSFGEEKMIKCSGAITYIQMHQIDEFKYRVLYRYLQSNWATRVYDYEIDEWSEEIIWLKEPHNGQYYLWTQADKEDGKVNIFMTCHPSNGTDQNIRYGYFDFEGDICVMDDSVIGNMNIQAIEILTPRDFDNVYVEEDEDGQTRLFDVSYKGDTVACLFGTFKGSNDCLYRYAYYDRENGEWVIESVTEAGVSQGNKSYYPGVSFDKKDMQTVYVAREELGDYYLEKWVTDNFGKTWSTTLIDKSLKETGDILFRPIVPYNAHEDISVLYLKGSYPSYLKFDTNIISYGFK